MIYTYSDLDDSLFNSKAKLLHPMQECSIGSLDNDGNPASFCSPKQKTLIDLLAVSGTLIPVTARSQRAFNNVALSFDSYAIINNGATILKSNGEEEHTWRELISGEVKVYSPLIVSLVERLDSIFAELGITPSINYTVMNGDMICYHTIKVDAEHADQLPSLNHTIQGLIDNNPDMKGIKVGFNGRALMIYPPYASKRRSVEYVNKLLGVTDNDLVIGIGDSLSDLDFMVDCDFSMIPKNSQITSNKLVENKNA